MNCKHPTCPLLEISLIPLTQGKYAIVDTEDYERLMRWKWHTSRGGHTYYAVRNTRLSQTHQPKRTVVRMHREILELPDGDYRHTDHRNHCGFDNRKCNIRTCLPAENQYNQSLQKNCESQFKGVRRSRGKWQARLCFNNKLLYLGSYHMEIDAARAYDAKAKELFGEFACVNII